MNSHRVGETMMEDRFVAHAWVERSGAVLLLHRLEGRYLGGQWDIPGGTVEADETPTAAAVRETWEEAGLVVVAQEEMCHYTNRDTRGRPLVFHTLTYRAIEPDAREVMLSPAEHDGYRWLPPKQALDLNLTWHVRATVESVLKIKGLPD